MDELIHDFEPKIRKCLLQTSPDERDDLRQVLWLKLTELSTNFNSDNAPNFDEFRAQVENR
ncbi:hypothetical protein JCM19037_4391 [Geomicrobium sp. JCM 19037]|nr:hypothetical protein JCM19037_4391 [Geomicrobium sp. JCM 19037]GAK13204.1 hypothetical protein JCM19039_3033 [Geomicrobium sp. JCM 19039]